VRSQRELGAGTGACPYKPIFGKNCSIWLAGSAFPTARNKSLKILLSYRRNPVSGHCGINNYFINSFLLLKKRRIASAYSKAAGSNFP
jgi:hypothetical protein